MRVIIQNRHCAPDESCKYAVQVWSPIAWIVQRQTHCFSDHGITGVVALLYYEVLGEAYITRT